MFLFVITENAKVAEPGLKGVSALRFHPVLNDRRTHVKASVRKRVPRLRRNSTPNRRDS